MRWNEIVSSQPRLGNVAHNLMIEPGVVLIGTTRRDGAARISGVEPLIMDGDLWLSMMRTSTKAQDLHRDSRILLHSIVTGPEAAPELKVRGTAALVSDHSMQARYAANVTENLGWEPVVGEFALFVIDIDDVTYIGYDTETGAQHVARWPAGEEYLRPTTTPTSLGPPEPVRRMLA
jgi:hypothetical protein